MSVGIEIVPKRCGWLYFERIEFIGFMICTMILLIPFTILLTAGVYSYLILFMIFAIFFLRQFFIKPYRRAKFIRSGGIYVVHKNVIELLWSNGEKEEYSIRFMSCSVKRRLGRMDVLFGRNFVDWIAHYGDKEQDGVGLYSIDRKYVTSILALTRK